MNEQKRITKRELLEKAVPAGLALPPQANPWTTYEHGVLAGARALGYDVIEEPEMPERLELRGWTSANGVDVVDPATYGGKPALFSLATQGSPSVSSALPVELVRRYNAKAAVLAVADGLERRAELNTGLLNSEGHRNVAQELRMAYGEGEKG